MGGQSPCVELQLLERTSLMEASVLSSVQWEKSPRPGPKGASEEPEVSLGRCPFLHQIYLGVTLARAFTTPPLNQATSTSHLGSLQPPAPTFCLLWSQSYLVGHRSVHVTSAPTPPVAPHFLTQGYTTLMLWSCRTSPDPLAHPPHAPPSHHTGQQRESPLDSTSLSGLSSPLSLSTCLEHPCSPSSNSWTHTPSFSLTSPSLRGRPSLAMLPEVACLLNALNHSSMCDLHHMGHSQ